MSPCYISAISTQSIINLDEVFTVAVKVKSQIRSQSKGSHITYSSTQTATMNSGTTKKEEWMTFTQR